MAGVAGETTFRAAIAAARFSGRGMEIVTLPVDVDGADEDEAAGHAFKVALETWPKKEYWTAHVARAEGPGGAVVLTGR